MKQEKTMPRGVAPVSRTGVHRKTKMYMQDSNRDCTHPNNKIFSSWNRNFDEDDFRSQVKVSHLENDPQPLHTRAGKVTLPVAIVLLPCPHLKYK